MSSEQGEMSSKKHSRLGMKGLALNSDCPRMVVSLILTFNCQKRVIIASFVLAAAVMHIKNTQQY